MLWISFITIWKYWTQSTKSTWRLGFGATGIRKSGHCVLLLLELEAHPLHRVNAAATLAQQPHLQDTEMMSSQADLTIWGKSCGVAAPISVTYVSHVGGVQLSAGGSATATAVCLLQVETMAVRRVNMRVCKDETPDQRQTSSCSPS